MRLFTAIDIPPDVKAALAVVLDKLRPLAKLKWIPLEKLHITTKFIGEWPDEPEARLDELKRALSSITGKGPVEIVIRGLGWLPNARRPRILYAGVEPGEGLTALAAATGQAVESVGIAPENRIYRPHVTLARINQTVRLDLEQSSIGRFSASSFALYLSAAGKYTKLQEFSFK